MRTEEAENVSGFNNPEDNIQAVDTSVLDAQMESNGNGLNRLGNIDFEENMRSLKVDILSIKNHNDRLMKQRQLTNDHILQSLNRIQ